MFPSYPGRDVNSPFVFYFCPVCRTSRPPPERRCRTLSSHEIFFPPALPKVSSFHDPPSSSFPSVEGKRSVCQFWQRSLEGFSMGYFTHCPTCDFMTALSPHGPHPLRQVTPPPLAMQLGTERILPWHEGSTVLSSPDPTSSPSFPLRRSTLQMVFAAQTLCSVPFPPAFPVLLGYLSLQPLDEFVTAWFSYRLIYLLLLFPTAGPLPE